MIGQLLVELGVLLFCAKRLLRYLRFFQQDDYSVERFGKWLLQKRAFDSKGSLIMLGALAATPFLPWVGVCSAAALALGCVAFWEENPLKEGKKPLVLTARAKRILWVSALMTLGLQAATLSVPSVYYWLACLLLFQSIPAILAGSALLLELDERRRQRALMAEARSVLNEVKPFVIGITGSYGKTSTKDALGQLLQGALGPTFWPPKGVNTAMGITRSIRDSLKRGHEFAVIEMGAYGIGSIQKLCALTPPDAAIITMVGKAHLERFGSEENIYRAKSELAQAVPEDGILVCNGDNVGARRMAREHPKRNTFLYGWDLEAGPLDCTLSGLTTTAQGSFFTVGWQGRNYSAFTPLLGRTALSNLLGAFTMACALGADPEYVLAVMANLAPVDNRLQVKTYQGVTYIHDAYNSNPVGFSAALEVMSSLPGRRRIVMTPGMVELADLQQSEHRRIGRLAGSICDMGIIVGALNKDTLLEGLQAGGMGREAIFLCKDREEAFKQLKAMVQPEDIVLIENDLPDWHEARGVF